MPCVSVSSTPLVSTAVSFGHIPVSHRVRIDDTPEAVMKHPKSEKERKKAKKLLRTIARGFLDEEAEQEDDVSVRFFFACDSSDA